MNMSKEKELVVGSNEWMAREEERCMRLNEEGVIILAPACEFPRIGERKCPKCGTPIVDDFNPCSKCGRDNFWL